MYVYLVVAVVNTYIFSMDIAKWLSLIHYRDNLIAITAAAAAAITAAAAAAKLPTGR